MKKLILIVLAVFLTFSEALPQWTSNALVNTSICNVTGDQATPKIASTSDGGCYIMWFDNRVANYPVYLQKLDKYGIPQFASNGMEISHHTQNTSLQDFNIDVDASDNAVIVFTDLRNGTVLNPFGYLISPSGAFLWGPNGVSLTDSTTLSQNIPVVAATSDGNYVFAWIISTTPNRVALQKLDINGTPQWGAAPIKMRGTGTENFNLARVIKSDAGSVIVSWDDYTGNITTTGNIKLFTQKFSSAGSKLWTLPQDTVQNIGKLAGISFIPYLISDGLDGAVYTWVDDRDANSRQSAWVQRFNSAGVAQFPKNGSEASTLSTDNHFLPSTAFVPSTGETYTFWTETNGGQTVVGGLDGQKFNSSGVQQWGASGIEFKSMDNNQLSFLNVYAKDTGVVVTYSETAFGSANVSVRGIKTGPSGVSQWPGNIVIAASSLSSKIRKQAILDRNSGMSVMTWSDNRSGSGDIYAQNINFDGTLGISAVNMNVTIGIEGMWNGSSQVQDTMRFYLRNNTSPYSVVDSAKVYLSSTGNGTAIFPNAASGNYYVSTKHRNALETWSANALIFTAGIATTYDFTTAQTQTFGNNSVLVSSKYCSYSGEVTHDGSIDISDLLAVFNDASNFTSGYVDSDVNGDNFVDISDILITYNNSANFVTVIRP